MPESNRILSKTEEEMEMRGKDMTPSRHGGGKLYFRFRGESRVDMTRAMWREAMETGK